MNIKTGWKLFEMRDDQKLFPLFIGKNTETPMGEWVMAEIVENTMVLHIDQDGTLELIFHPLHGS